MVSWFPLRRGPIAWWVTKGPTMVWQKDPKPLTPRPASSDGTDAGHGRPSQLAALTKGSPGDESVRPLGRVAGVEHWGEGVV